MNLLQQARHALGINSGEFDWLDRDRKELADMIPEPEPTRGGFTADDGTPIPEFLRKPLQLIQPSSPPPPASDRELLATVAKALIAKEGFSLMVDTTAAPAEHQASLRPGLDQLRSTEAELIQTIKDKMQSLANVQHAIRCFTQLDANLAEPVAAAVLEPVTYDPPPSPAPQVLTKD